MAQIAAIRAAVGPDVEIMVDAGICWDAATAGLMAARLAPYNIFWLEEPLHPVDVAGYARLTARTPIRIAAGEEDASIYAFEDLLDRGGVAVVQPDASRAADLTESLRIAELRIAADAPAYPTTSAPWDLDGSLAPPQRGHSQCVVPGVSCSATRPC